MIEFSIPFPPSTNKIWRRAGHRIYLAPDGVKYRAAVAAVVATLPDRFGEHDRLALEIVATMPDRRRRDLDNLLKSTQDALQAAGLFPDDAQIDLLAIRRAEVSKPGRLDLKLWRVNVQN